jgi:DNA-directed RNA polymerase specialized sigma24 family protein
VLLLHYIERFSVQQICTILGKSSKQIYNLLARAKTALKEILIKEGISHEDL